MILELSVLCPEMLIFSYGALVVSRSGIFNYNVQLFSRLLVNIFSTCKHIFIFCFCAIKSPLFFISVLKIANYFLVFFFWNRVALQSSVSFCCTPKGISQTRTYALFLRFPSHLRPHRALSRVPSAIQ